MARVVKWAGQEGLTGGDVLGLSIDCQAGSMRVFKNGRQLGVAPLPGWQPPQPSPTPAQPEHASPALSWAAALTCSGSSVRLRPWEGVDDV